ncbi:TPA: elongation factor 1-beta [Candidatus Woesearchaeota archaeon]|nr:elongation factor 1-beta [Candidatus Woesearchaeota archaeon]HII68662.1 elongation factor 1-beta [Candidatus Woesearchaeota archaeon]
MTDVIVTIRIMPESPDTELAGVEKAARKEVVEFAGEQNMRTEIEPIAFGLSALKLTFATPEEKGSTDPLEEKLREIDGVASAEVIDVRRALG